MLSVNYEIKYAQTLSHVPKSGAFLFTPWVFRRKSISLWNCIQLYGSFWIAWTSSWNKQVWEEISENQRQFICWYGCHVDRALAISKFIFCQFWYIIMNRKFLINVCRIGTSLGRNSAYFITIVRVLNAHNTSLLVKQKAK